MFILRKITQNGLEWNLCLGESYSVITEERNPVQFKETVGAVDYSEPEVYGFVFNDDNGQPIPLYRKQKNYIMTDSGKTFSNISL